ncbi:hypothetical protein BDR03DRAFT_95687 [Suillus americanus]|nr:hypothetical protein BDR03DRAFT_95687 [Suillus americanus]
MNLGFQRCPHLQAPSFCSRVHCITSVLSCLLFFSLFRQTQTCISIKCRFCRYPDCNQLMVPLAESHSTPCH